MTSRHCSRAASGFGLRRVRGLRPSGFGLLPGAILLLTLRPSSVFACAACYGQSDSPMAQGMNWGIVSLLAVIAVVLGGVAAFFIYLARRSAAMSARAAEPLLPLMNLDHGLD